MHATLTIVICGTVTPFLCSTIIGLFIRSSVNRSSNKNSEITDPQNDWYLKLKKPPSYLPMTCFVPLFVLMNSLMGIASVAVINSEEIIDDWGLSEKRMAIICYLMQFVLSHLWPVSYFLCHKVIIALIQVVLTQAVCLFCIKLFFQLTHWYGIVAVAHLMWTSYWFLTLYSVCLLNCRQEETPHEKLLSRQRSRESGAGNRSYGGVYV